MATAVEEMRDYELDRYLDINLPGWNSSSPPANMISNTELCDEDEGWIDTSEDILPFLRLSTLAPGVKITYKSSFDGHAADGFNLLFSDRTPEWSYIVQNDLIIHAVLTTFLDEAYSPDKRVVVLQLVLKRTRDKFKADSHEVKAVRASLERLGWIVHDNEVFSCLEIEETSVCDARTVDFGCKAYIFGKVLGLCEPLYESSDVEGSDDGVDPWHRTRFDEYD